MTKVSVFLTSYNHDKYLHESIASVLSQTYSDFELIILDDASTDNSWNIINNYSDPRIRAFRNEINRSCEFPGIFPEEGMGHYIAIHHSDDVWEPTKLAKQVAFLDSNPHICAVFSQAHIIDEKGDSFRNESNFYHDVFNQPNRTRFEWLNYFFYKGNALCHPAVLMRKDCYKGNNYRHGLAQIPDFDFWVQLCLKYEIHIIQEKLVRFRVRNNETNTSGNRPDTRIRFQFEFLQVLKHYTHISNIDELIKIFPNAEKYINKKNADLLYALGMVAVDTGQSAVTKLFGLNLLFDALNDSDRAKKLYEYNCFDQKAFIELSAKHDIYAVETVRTLQTRLTDRDQTIAQLQADEAERIQTIAQLQADQAERDRSIGQLRVDQAERDQTIAQLKVDQAERIQEVLSYALSRSWQITRPLRKLWKLLKREKSC